MRHVPRKRFGQNFLIDEAVIAAIVAAIAPQARDLIVEIGPGLGALTRPLAALLDHLHVVEIDRDIIARLRIEYPAARVTVHEGDALKFDPCPLLGAPPVRVVANLPYNIATALLVGWLTLEPCPPWYDRLVLMFQREVAERIVAAPGSKSYGRLSVLAGWRCEARIRFDVAGTAFVPPPKVTSSLVELVPRQNPLPCERRALERVTEAAFGQRRKMLRQSLKSLGPDSTTLLEAAKLEPTSRAETVPVEVFVALARAFAAR